MTFDMPNEKAADKVEYEAWELQNVIDELKPMVEESHPQEAAALSTACDGLACLIESHKLLHHYARLLNEYDLGQRVIPESVLEWIQRCKEVANAQKEKYP